ncbi:MAG: HAMP domain-containing histidine kinase [Lachnospiraceae bacterium]|nr:HAMP domain-containing histidine kinase [Lachnospiraceae bacterium]MCI9371722.1 HAMP domain-containing histidine kinase [Lachnospiraceae bacterium]MDE7307228.1 HAMP domain-containing histidine kinase [Lachnospiraceae bacterium]
MSKKKYTKPDISREELEKALVKANQELWMANRRLEAEERTRAELFSNLSHDLRAPMTALFSAVELLKSGQEIGEKKYQDILKLMDRRLHTLQSILNDIFLLTLLESPSTKIETEPVEMGIFLEDYFYSCTADPKYHKRRLKLEVPDSFPYTAEIEAEKMIRVLDNLFTNALRYSGEGAEIALGARFIAGEKDEGKIRIYVRDTGEGIHKEDSEHIFERSYRASRSRTPEHEGSGSGLGLAIAKGIVERHGGAIWCESEVGKGSCFTFSLTGKKL